MRRTWTDPRDSRTWNVTVEGRGAVVGVASMQLLNFVGPGGTLTSVYEGDRELPDMTDEELQALLDAGQDLS